MKLIEDTLSKNYLGWIGLGLLYMWGCAIVAWMDYWNSYETWIKVLAFLGGALVSISGTAIAVYTSKLEEKIRQLNERSKNSEME